MAFPFEWDTLEQQQAALEAALTGADASGPARTLEDFGAQLFQALFCGEVGRVYDLSRQAAAADGKGLRVKLRINAPELTAIPWEFLYDRRRREFVALSRHTPIVRYLELPLPDPELAVSPPLRILALAASPADLVPLDVEREKARLEDAVGELKRAGKLELTWLEGGTWRDVLEAMQGGPWHIFHFVGHAAWDHPTGQGVLLLPDEYGDASPLSADQLGRLLADHPSLRLALLNACEGARGGQASSFSSMASLLVERGLPAVVAMQVAISDRAAVEFTTSFYRALVVGLPIDAGVSEARKAMSLAVPGSPEWGTPALFMRAPDGVIWNVEKDAEPMSDANRREAQAWWDQLSDSLGDFSAQDVEGDVIIATVGAGARNVAIGKNITQLVYETLGQPTPDDRHIIEQQLEQARETLERSAGEIGQGAVTLAKGILDQMGKELLKTGEGQKPDAATITQMGDLLLSSVPPMAEALAGLFATPAVGRVVGKAGEAAVKWVKERF
jgi:hypothetical protein